MEKYLTHRGIDMWLTDSKDRYIPHVDSFVDDNTISAGVNIRRGALYTVNWKCSTNSPPLSAFWEAFVSSIPQSGRNNSDDQFPEGIVIASHFIDERDPQSRAHSSTKDRLFPPYNRNGHLKTPRSVVRGASLGFVRLEFRRTQGDINFWETAVPGKPGEHDCHIVADVVDDKNEGKAPYIIFQFNFIDTSAATSQGKQVPAKRPPTAQLSAPSPKHSSAKRPRLGSPSTEPCHTGLGLRNALYSGSNPRGSAYRSLFGKTTRENLTQSSKKSTQLVSLSSIISGSLTRPSQPSDTSQAGQTRRNLSARFPRRFPKQPWRGLCRVRQDQEGLPARLSSSGCRKRNLGLPIIQGCNLLSTRQTCIQNRPLGLLRVRRCRDLPHKPRKRTTH